MSQPSREGAEYNQTVEFGQREERIYHKASDECYQKRSKSWAWREVREYRILEVEDEVVVMMGATNVSLRWR